MHNFDMDPPPRRGQTARGGPLSGALVFLITIILMLTVAAPVQASLGMWGLALTELMFVAVALGAAGLFRFSLRDAFPLPVPTARQVGATVVLWAGYLGLALSATLASAYFFPREVLGVGEQLSEAFSSMPFALTLLTVAAMPAVCEEILCRGLIQHTMRRVRSRWVTISVMAVMFGIFHLNPFRFLPTAILGFALAYLRDKSGSLTLPMLMHFINNAFSSMGSLLNETGAGEAVLDMSAVNLTEMIPALIFFYSIGSPLLIHIGCLLLNPPPPLGTRRIKTARERVRLAVVLLLTALLVVGFILNSDALTQEIFETRQYLAAFLNI